MLVKVNHYDIEKKSNGSYEVVFYDGSNVMCRVEKLTYKIAKITGDNGLKMGVPYQETTDKIPDDIFYSDGVEKHITEYCLDNSKTFNDLSDLDIIEIHRVLNGSDIDKLKSLINELQKEEKRGTFY